MKLKLALLTIFTVFCMVNVGAATSVTPTKDSVTQIMLDYDLQGQNNSYELACSIGQNVSEEYNINVDIRELKFSNHSPVYIDVFYPKAENSRGYQAYYGWFGPQKKEVVGFNGKDKSMYYRDWGSSENSECRIVGVCSYPIVKSYFGTTTRMVIEDPVSNETIVKENDVSIVENTTTEVNNSAIVGINENVENVSGEINNQGNNNTNVIVQGNSNIIQKFELYFSNVSFENVSNFFNLGGHYTP